MSAERRLTLVPTPVGNLGDVTQRALEVLALADVVAAEDTRHSRALLDRYGIEAQLERLDAHTMEARAPGLLERYPHVAYVTDAGTPGISDPGGDLVRIALELGVAVEVLPGATAFVPALVESGLPTARFTFEGFLPRKGGERKRRLEAIAAATATSVLYESPNRLAATLADLAAACGEARAASVSRELSKLHHETRRGSLEALAAHFAATPPRGEIVVVVGPAPQPDAGEQAADLALTAERLAGAGVRGRLLRDALSALGAPRNEAYRLALDHPDDAGGPE
ncbi:MAG: 16S rRNA (cytidine(1402)-2'-O)-methyltransferase [Deinococcales bacterium]|nr:16S rRNA (cytidine(1402)-2'-O)-methyltransferase [Deinococcales bacterium]